MDIMLGSGPLGSGRTGPGSVFSLMSAETFDDLPKFDQNTNFSIFFLN